MKYVVEVHAPVLETPHTLVRKLVEQFNVRSEVAKELLRLVPGTVTKPVSEKEATTISSMLSGVGLNVSTHLVPATTPGFANPPLAGNSGTATDVARTPTRRRNPSSIRGRFLASSLLPIILTVATALAVVLLTVRPALQTQLLETARTPAIAFASVAERVIGANDISSWAAMAELDAAMEDARSNLQQQNISFLILTDKSGQPLAGWYGNDSEMNSIPKPISTAVQLQSQRVTRRDDGPPTGNTGPTIEAAGIQLGVVAEVLEINSERVGAVVVGVTTQDMASTMRLVFNRTLFSGALPVVLALLLSVLLTRNVTRKRLT